MAMQPMRSILSKIQDKIQFKKEYPNKHSVSEGSLSMHEVDGALYLYIKHHNQLYRLKLESDLRKPI